MRRLFILLGFIILVVLLETIFLRPFNLREDLVLVILVILSFRLKFRESLILALYAGILKDSFNYFPFGINTLLFVPMILLGRFFSKRIASENKLALAGFVFLFSIFNYFLRSLFFLQKIIFWNNLILNCFLESITNLFLSFLFLFWPVRLFLWKR